MQNSLEGKGPPENPGLKFFYVTVFPFRVFPIANELY